jgi:hypothetical protein
MGPPEEDCCVGRVAEFGRDIGYQISGSIEEAMSDERKRV